MVPKARVVAACCALQKAEGLCADLCQAGLGAGERGLRHGGAQQQLLPLVLGRPQRLLRLLRPNRRAGHMQTETWFRA